MSLDWSHKVRMVSASNTAQVLERFTQFAPGATVCWAGEEAIQYITLATKGQHPFLYGAVCW